mgnify:CR=1 FL=1
MSRTFLLLFLFAAMLVALSLRPPKHAGAAPADNPAALHGAAQTHIIPH